MDDSCAVCADTREWVAYGPCGHREVCSTCIVRLRFICNDHRCCLCKSESNIVFITKALGDYTRVISDFSVFPADPTEGQVGPYWYHEGIRAYFDDLDQYKVVEAMCRLCCCVCDEKKELKNAGPKRSGEFKNIDRLKSHLFSRHRLLMCSLCLEGRKVFIREQKLYSRAQLNQHIKTGDSEVDGSESERGGFKGHPMCEFCDNPFYGDNELYLHMSTEHYTCHICQRHHPGHYEYHQDYDDMEIHFRHEHFLCEDEACLEKKFVVFATEPELKRHTAKEHGGHMSRFKRNAAQKIPVSFRYRLRCEQTHHGRRQGSGPESSDRQPLQANLVAASTHRFYDVSTDIQVVSGDQGSDDVASIIGRFSSLTTRDSDPPSRGHQALRSYQNGPLEQSSFPPLSMPNDNQQQSINGSEQLAGSTMAARLRRQNKVTIISHNTSQAWTAANHQPNLSAATSRPSGLLPSRTLHNKPALRSEFPSSSYASSTNGFANGSSAANIVSSSTGHSTGGRVGHFASASACASATASNHGDGGSLDNLLSSFPPVSDAKSNNSRAPKSGNDVLKVDDIQSANKALVEKIRDALEFNKDKFSAFKHASGEYCKGLISTEEYLAHVYQFGLSHLVADLARLCPDAEKRSELVETYSFHLRSGGGGSLKNSASTDSGRSTTRRSSKKGKEKCEDSGAGDSCLEKLEVSVEDGHYSRKGKEAQPTSKNSVESSGSGSKANMAMGVGNENRPRKKKSKFLRNRLGEASATTVAELGDSGRNPHLLEENKEQLEGLSVPARGAWRNGGGQNIVAMYKRK